MKAISRMAVPMAMPSCGIHNGDASAPGEMSWVVHESHTMRLAYHASISAMPMNGLASAERMAAVRAFQPT